MSLDEKTQFAMFVVIVSALVVCALGIVLSSLQFMVVALVAMVVAWGLIAAGVVGWFFRE